MISSQLNRWLWKWHVIAGVITLPFVMLLTITGAVYLFKNDINNALYDEIKFIEPKQANYLSYDKQLDAVKAYTKTQVTKLTLADDETQATQFVLKGRGHASNTAYVNPYTAEVTGTINQKDTLMYTIRKLHGELLLDDYGEWFIELVASWFIVLLMTGVVIWFPYKNVKLAGFFTIRFNQSKRLMWRDFHAVCSFWVSIILLIIIAGGMPWTKFFGGQLKWVQQQTDTGYPVMWRKANALKSTPQAAKLSIDDMVKIAINQQLDGRIIISLPKDDVGVFSISNRSLWLSDQKVIHVDQYSGETLKTLTWSDVGILMDLRQVFMRLHQGEYGAINLWVMLVTCLTFFVASIGGLTSYLMRRPEGQFGVPKVPASFKASGLVVGMIVVLGVMFPLFGFSVVLIALTQWLISLKKSK